MANGNRELVLSDPNRIEQKEHVVEYNTMYYIRPDGTSFGIESNIGGR
jgi:hypothetical protein